MKFRKKPVVIEAEQFYPDRKPWPEGVNCGNKVLNGIDGPITIKRAGFWIETLEGVYIVKPGDWIITGVKGERYPCRFDIFEMTYEPVEDIFTKVV